MKHSLIGKVLRFPLGLIQPNAVVRVILGPGRGMRWIAGAAPHGAWLGTLERSKLGHLIARLSEADVFWDIGANVGLYTLPAARRVGPSGRVFAFEPMPRNVEILRSHIAMNGFRNVTVVAAGVGDEIGTLRMAEGKTPSEFHADPAGTYAVRSITLDSWQVESQSPLPRIIKMDVEGAEAAVFRGARRVIALARPLIYVALHGQRQRTECGEFLERCGYQCHSLGPEPVAKSDEWLAEPD